MKPNGKSTTWLALALVVTACSADTASDRAPGGSEPGLAGAAGSAGGAPLDPGAAELDPGGTPGQSSDPIAGQQPTGTTGTPIPCDVANVVASNCHTCHGATPVGGAIRLMTHEDWHQTSPVYAAAKLGDPTKKVHEVAKIRIENKEMPQGRTLADPDFTTLDAWLAGGALAGTAADTTCAPNGGGDPGAIVPAPAGPDGSQCSAPGANDPLVQRPGETCYEFVAHGVSSPTDTSKFSVISGESYNQFYYDVPWPADSVATRFGSDFDNEAVLHHWLLFDTAEALPAGWVAPNVLGTTIGTDAKLLAVWAIGGCNMEMPSEVGLQLPSPGRKIMVQWHHFNSTGNVAQDGSKVQVCTVPASSRAHVAGITWLGTENFNGPAGMPTGMSEFHGTCINDSQQPITILGWFPHMHLMGIHMKSVVTRVGGGAPETVFDKPFRFDYQINYVANPAVVLQPGDSIQSTCTFMNTSGSNVAFGQSTNQEMCYQFAVSYPVGALNNGVPSLIGATDTCWQFGE